MSAQEEAAKTGGKYILWSLLALIVLLVVVKQLGMNPSEANLGAASIKFAGGIAPKQTSTSETPPSQTNAQLEDRVRQLETEKRTRQEAQASSPAPAPGLNVAGLWQAGWITLNITQVGNFLTVQVYVSGVLTAAGQGSLAGRKLEVSYLNNMNIPGRFEAVVSDNGRQLHVTDYGAGFPQSLVYSRAM